MAFTAGLKPEIHPGNQSKDLHCSCSTTACQETSSRSKCCRQEECGRGTKSQVCTLRTRQAPSRTASLWTVIFLRFKSMPFFPVWSCTKCSCLGDCQTERELKPGVFCVNKEWRKKCVLLFPMPHLAGFHVLRKTSMVMSVDIFKYCLFSFFVWIHIIAKTEQPNL